MARMPFGMEEVFFSMTGLVGILYLVGNVPGGVTAITD